MFHAFPMEGWLLYIFLYIDSTQGGWGRRMSNKSDEVASSRVQFSTRCAPVG